MNETVVSSIVEKVVDLLRNRFVPIGISNRHVHLSADDYDRLFPNQLISEAKSLFQPGHFAANQVVTLVGPKGNIPNVRILGPLRKQTQVEIASTNARELGLNVPVRQSGELSGTPGLILRSEFSEITIPEGVIVAQRHIHMSPTDAMFYGIDNNQEVDVSVGSAERSIVMNNVVVRVDPSTVLEMHIDTDEANAAGLSGREDFGTIVLSE